MIHYTPELHHDKLVKYIAEAYLSGYELDEPFMMPRNNGEPNHCLITEDKTFYFPDNELRRELYCDAYQLYESTLKERGQASILDWSKEFTEEGIVFTDGDRKILMTSKPYWSKKQSHP